MLQRHRLSPLSASRLPAPSAWCLPALAIAFTVILVGMAHANDSVYSRVDETTCRWDPPPSGEEEGDFGCATCTGHGGYFLRLCEGDLRQSVFYGSVMPAEMSWNTFGQFNHAGPTVEWRLSQGEPVAAIHRFFIDNMNDSGEVDPARQGQVLVVSTVARPDRPLSCPVGYVDTRVNANANALARQVADDIAPGFRCGTDQASFYGSRGPYSGSPTGLSQ